MTSLKDSGPSNAHPLPQINMTVHHKYHRAPIVCPRTSYLNLPKIVISSQPDIAHFPPIKFSHLMKPVLQFNQTITQKHIFILPRWDSTQVIGIESAQSKESAIMNPESSHTAVESLGADSGSVSDSPSNEQNTGGKPNPRFLGPTVGSVARDLWHKRKNRTSGPPN